MKHLLRRALPLLAVAALVGVVAPTPAHAHVDSCTGQFELRAGSGLGLPSDAPVNTSFSINTQVGGCTSGSLFTASGNFTGSCALGSGTGMTTTGHTFSFQLTGVITFTGQVVGTMNALPNATAGQSCVSRASQFILTGTVALVH